MPFQSAETLELLDQMQGAAGMDGSVGQGEVP
jgi:hypothetical protein